MFTGVFSKQTSERKTIVAEGGGTVQDFELFALDYEQNRNFFLSQYFRYQYDHALRNYPYVDSRVRITRVELWVTRSEERRVGKECRYRWSLCRYNKRRQCK